MEFDTKNLGFDLDPGFFFLTHFPLKVGLNERTLLRKKLVESLKNKSPFNTKKESSLKRLLIPGKAPKSPWAKISISHSKKRGAFLWTRNKKIKAIGFDMEEKKRVKDKTVQFVSSKKEVRETPHPALLWVAKEASFKASSSLFLEDIEISNWKKKENLFFFLTKSKKKKLRGISFFFKDLSFAIVKDEISSF